MIIQGATYVNKEESNAIACNELKHPETKLSGKTPIQRLESMGGVSCL